MNLSPLLRSILIGVGTPVLIMVVSVPFFGWSRENARSRTCQSNLYQIGLVIKQYCQDYDGVLPLVAMTPAPSKSREDLERGPSFGWAVSLIYYSKSTGLYQCPSETTAGTADYFSKHSGYVDYWFNAQAAGRKSLDATLILMGDGDGQHNARYAISGLPADWKEVSRKKREDDEQPPCYLRHVGGANYAFADGHVKWLRPERLGDTDAHFNP